MEKVIRALCPGTGQGLSLATMSASRSTFIRETKSTNSYLCIDHSALAGMYVCFKRLFVLISLSAVKI